MQGFEIKFNIYANSEEEVATAREAIINFINLHAEQGRAISATKLTEAINNWDKNPFVKSGIIKHFS